MGLHQVVWVLIALFGVVNCGIFVVGYHIKSQGTWRYYPMGRHLMALAGVLGVIFGLIAASQWWGPLGFWIWATSLLTLNLVILQRNWMLFTRKWRSSASAPSEDTVAETRRR